MLVMRYLAVAMLAVALFAAGYLAADLLASDADAQGAWQYAIPANRMELEELFATLDSDCAVDLEFSDALAQYLVAYACPD